MSDVFVLKLIEKYRSIQKFNGINESTLLSSMNVSIRNVVHCHKWHWVQHTNGRSPISFFKEKISEAACTNFRIASCRGRVQDLTARAPRSNVIHVCRNLNPVSFMPTDNISFSFAWMLHDLNDKFLCTSWSKILAIYYYTIKLFASTSIFQLILIKRQQTWRYLLYHYPLTIHWIRFSMLNHVSNAVLFFGLSKLLGTL